MTRTKRKPASLTDWRTIENEREKYAAYLCSREWGVLKEAVHKRSGGKCERCGILPGNAVHHLTYERKYREEIEDLQHTCHACHDFTHGKSDFDPIGTCESGSYVQGESELSQWTRYVLFCFKHGSGEPVPDSWAYFGWRESKNDVIRTDRRFLAIIALWNLYTGSVGESVFQLPCVDGDDEYEELVLAEVVEEANEAFGMALKTPKDTVAWCRFGCPEIDYKLYDESIRQVRKCL